MMTNWLVFSPFSKHSFWNKITEQTNKTSLTAETPQGKKYYLSVNELDQPKVFLSHWTKNDSQFILDINPVTRELIVVRPNNLPTDENPFKREIDTDKIKKWLDIYPWVAFGYIIVPEGVDRFTAMDRSTYYTRDNESNLVMLDTGQLLDQVQYQPTQHWFIATRAADDLYIMFCHPDILVPSFGIEYQTDCHGDMYYTLMDENFDYYDLACQVSSPNAVIQNGVIYSQEAYIDLIWSQGSHLANNTDVAFKPVAPDLIHTDLDYEITESGIRIANQRGCLTTKYTVGSLLQPSILVDKLGLIEKKFIILGV